MDEYGKKVERVARRHYLRNNPTGVWSKARPETQEVYRRIARKALGPKGN